MNFIHYLFIKGETTFGSHPGKGFFQGGRLSGRSIICYPLWLFAMYLSMPWIPSGLSDFSIWVIIISYFLLLYGLTYLLIPRKTVKKNLKRWMRRYKRTTSLWAYLYLFSPIIAMVGYVIFKCVNGQ